MLPNRSERTTAPPPRRPRPPLPQRAPRRRHMPLADARRPARVTAASPPVLAAARPAVARFLAANGTAYTVMEFEDGRSLGDLLRQSERGLPRDDVRRLTEGLLLGLGAVHAQGFLHRDIKPSNIIIRRDGVPILIDFGAARQAIGWRTRTLTGVLTPQYAPIEQYALDGKHGPWSDIYSAGAVLHLAIAG